MKVVRLTFLFFLLLLSCKTEYSKNNIGFNSDRVLEIQKLIKESSSPNITIEKQLSYIKKAQLKASEYNIDSLILKSITKESTLYGKLENYDAAILSTRELLNKATIFQDEVFIALAFKKLARYYFKKDEKSKAYRYYILTYDKYKKLNDSISMSRARKQMAEIEKDISDFELSESHAVEALDLLPLNYYSDRSSIFHLLSITQREQDFYQRAKMWIDSAIHLNNRIEKRKLRDQRNEKYLNTKAVILRDSGNFIGADIIFSKLLNRISKNENPYEYARVWSNQAINAWEINKNDPFVEDNLLSALIFRKKIKDSKGLIASNEHLSQYYLDTDKKKSRKYTENLLELAKQNGALEEQITALNRLIKFESNLKIKNVLINNKERIRDSLFKRSKEEKANYAVIRLSKESEIRSYERNIKIKDEKIHNAQKTTIIYFVMIILAIIIIIILVFWFRARQKIVSLKTIRLTETRISKKIHDELANDVFQVMSQLELQKAPDETLDQLDGIYQKTRDISKEHQPIDTNTPFPKTLSTMLSSLVPEHAKLVLRGLDNFKWETLNMQKKTELYRSLQELMTNMKRHSQATHITIAFTKVGQALKIRYSDNGVGIQTANYQKGGLQNVESRIASIKGILTFETDDISGLKAEIQIPV